MRISRLVLTSAVPVALAIATLGLAPPARAQTFPADNRWVPFDCGAGRMVDGVRDQSAAVGERDLVGNSAAPAGFRVVDAGFLYLRLRVEAIPTLAGRLRPFAWGFAFSTDALSGSYEVLITVDGSNDVVAVYRNSVMSVPNSPTDPADAPPVATYPFATHGRTALTGDSNFGGSPDHFIDMAVPWDALGPFGLAAQTPIVVWAGSSSSADRLDGDLACHDAGGTAGVPDLDASPSGTTTASSTVPAPTGGSGGSPVSGDSLEGGPGCSYGPRAMGASLLPALLLIPLMARRRRRLAR